MGVVFVKTKLQNYRLILLLQASCARWAVPPQCGDYGAAGRHGHCVGDGVVVVFLGSNYDPAVSTCHTKLAIMMFPIYFNHNFAMRIFAS